MKRRRIVESQQEKLVRKEQDRVRKERMRTSATYEQALNRQKQDSLHKESMYNVYVTVHVKRRYKSATIFFGLRWISHL